MSVHVGRFLVPLRHVTAWPSRETAPAAVSLAIIYSLVAPLLLLDAWVSFYQAVCSRLLGIARVRRREYILDRHHLAYLNPVERANRMYCGYATGVIALVREVAARTEEYWCPIKHARPPAGRHPRYRRFAPYGDEVAYRQRQPALRRELRRNRGTSRRRQ